MVCQPVVSYAFPARPRFLGVPADFSEKPDCSIVFACDRGGSVGVAGGERGGGTDRGREKKGEIRKKEKKNSPLATHLRRRAGVAVGHGAAGRREGTARGRTRDPPQGGGLGEGLAEHCVSLDLDDYMSIDLKGIFLKKKSKSKRDYIGKSHEEGGAETSRIRRKKLRLLLTFDR